MKTILPALPAVGKRRLRKLIAHLKTMPRKRFDFGQILVKTACGTVGCAIGETPNVFPRLVEARPYYTRESFVQMEVFPRGYVEDPDNPRSSIGLTANTLFGMPQGHRFVFCPEEQGFVHESLPICASNATPKQVAQMLEKYLRLTETEVKS